MPELPEQADDLDSPLEHSPLERDITRDGTTVRVLIYRGMGDAGWLLEVEDELGGSTVWDDVFASDQEALAEALRTVEEDGIHSFTQGASDRTRDRGLWALVVAQPAIAELRRMLEGAEDMVGFQEACGMLAAVATCPEFVAPSGWLEMLMRDHIFEDRAHVQRFTNGVMSLYSEVLRSVSEGGAHCCPAPNEQEAVRAFCAGYVKVALSDATWSQDAGGVVKLLPLCALAGAVPLEKVGEILPSFAEDPDSWLRRAREELPETVASLYVYWDEERRAGAERVREGAAPRRREGPKVGRNDPCPCGSGKKFKKCCAN